MLRRYYEGEIQIADVEAYNFDENGALFVRVAGFWFVYSDGPNLTEDLAFLQSYGIQRADWTLDTYIWTCHGHVGEVVVFTSVAPDVALAYLALERGRLVPTTWILTFAGKVVPGAASHSLGKTTVAEGYGVR